MNLKNILGSAALLFAAALPLSASAMQPMVLKAGSFVGAAHGTSGTATIYKLANGSYILRLSNFETSNGPKVHVVLDTHPVMGNNVLDSGSVDLGDLKGTSGSQNYAIPAGTNVASLKGVAIYCERFHVTFGSAKLH